MFPPCKLVWLFSALHVLKPGTYCHAVCSFNKLTPMHRSSPEPHCLDLQVKVLDQLWSMHCILVFIQDRCFETQKCSALSFFPLIMAWWTKSTPRTIGAEHARLICQEAWMLSKCQESGRPLVQLSKATRPCLIITIYSSWFCLSNFQSKTKIQMYEKKLYASRDSTSRNTKSQICETLCGLKTHLGLCGEARGLFDRNASINHLSHRSA